MNIHNHSLWPPPGGTDLNRPVLTAGHGVWPSPACAPLIVPALRSPHGAQVAVIQPMDRG